MTHASTRSPRFSGLVALSVLMLAAHAEATPLRGRLRLLPERVHAGTMRVKVLLVSRVPLGAYTLEASVDPGAAEIAAIEGGGTPEFGASPFVNDAAMTTGTVRFAAFQAARLDGPKGAVHVATLVLRSRAQRGKAYLRVRPVSVVDTAARSHRVRARRRALRVRDG
jgi:hypothetical protein